MKKPLIFFIFLLLVLSIISSSLVLALPGEDCNYVSARGKVGGTECDPGEYCSEELECQLLKLEDADCQNNYECENFRCLEGTCGGTTAVGYYAQTFSWLKKVLFWLQGRSIRCDDGTAALQCSTASSTTLIGYRCGLNTITQVFELYEDSTCRLAGTCTDSDVDGSYPDGINYFTQGTVVNTNFAGSTDTDFCTDQILTEYYCGGPNLDITSTIPSLCAAPGCQNGACLPPTIPDCTTDAECTTPTTPICDIPNGVCIPCTTGWQGDIQCRLKYNDPNYICAADGSCQLPTGPVCSITNCDLCTTQATCEAETCNWWSDSTCHLATEPPQCSITNCDLCTTQATCEAETCNWWTDSTCHLEQEPVPCSITNCDMCTTIAECTAEGCSWWSDATCNPTPEPLECTSLTCDSPACQDQTSCQNNGCYWDSLATPPACSTPTVQCTIANCEDQICQTVDECNTAQCYWDGTICTTPITTQCTIADCTAAECQTQTECFNQGCYWDGTACSAQAPLPACTEHNDCTADPSKALCDLDSSSTTYQTCITGYRLKDEDPYFHQDIADPDWVWDIGNLDQTTATTINKLPAEPTGPYIGIENDFVKTVAADNPITEGDCYYYPSNYISICLDSINGEAMVSVRGQPTIIQGELTISGGVIGDEISIGNAITSADELSENLVKDDISVLEEHTITFNGVTINAHEEVILSETSPSIEDSTTSDTSYTDVVMEVQQDSMKYYYVFDDPIDLTTISTANPLEITFLGKQLKITGITTNPSIIIEELPDECSDYNECLPGQECDSFSQCVEPECREDTQCTTSDPYCVDYQCIECRYGTDCTSNQYCNAIGNCIDQTTTPGTGQAPSEGRRRYTETRIDTEVNEKIQATQSFCGDGTCYFGETPQTCPTDCQTSTGQDLPSSVCGDSIPDLPVENCENCETDVKCQEGQTCKNGECVKKSSLWVYLLPIILILILVIVILIYIRMKKPKTIIQQQRKPTIIQQPKTFQQQILKRRQQILEQQKQRQATEQRRRQEYEQRIKQQRQDAQRKQQQFQQRLRQHSSLNQQRQVLQTQKLRQEHVLKTKEQELKIQKQKQDFLARIKQQQLAAEKQMSKLQSTLKKPRKKRAKKKKKKKKKRKKRAKKKPTIQIKTGRTPGTKITIK